MKAAPTRLTRKQASAELGISMATLRRWEGKRIQPIMTPLGEHVFNPSHVRQLAAAMKRGDVARPKRCGRLSPVQRLAVYRALARGADREQLAAKYGVSPHTIGHLGPAFRYLSRPEILAIRAALKSGERVADVAERVGKTRQHIWQIRVRKSWGWVTTAKTRKPRAT